jgi:hypothetical protein
MLFLDVIKVSFQTKLNQFLTNFHRYFSPFQTLNEKRNRLETTLNRLMTQLRLRLNDQSPSMDLSYLLTGRGARSRRTNNPTPVPV